MLKRSVRGLLALALGATLAGCQQGEPGGGGGGQGAGLPGAAPETAGDHFEEAYTSLAEVHIALVQGDWDSAAEAMPEVRESLDGMKQAQGRRLPAVIANRINELQQSALQLDQMIANRNPGAIAQSRTLMNTFTRESSLAQVGREGGGAGAAGSENR